jgi:ankyrin repeat protein
MVLFIIPTLYVRQHFSKQHYTALGIAGLCGRAACVTLLVKAGAEVNYKTKEVPLVVDFVKLKVPVFRAQ